jgi:hypothetical protein
MVSSRTRAATLAAIAAGVLAVSADAGRFVRAADVTLQVIPRGQGSVTGTAAGATKTCTANQEPLDCKWTFAAGTTVVLTASGPLSKWSTPDCEGTGAQCTVTLDDDTSVVALFGKLTLSVATSGAKSGDVVKSNTGGISCPPTCAAEFDAGATVTLTVTTAAGSTFTSFPYGCTSTSGSTCTVTVLDEPQSVGVKFNGAAGPGVPDVVRVTVRIRKAGDGSGRITAKGLDCGNVCSASFPYGELAGFSAAVESGSLFGGWGGVCAANLDTRCTLPIGPITLLRPRFTRDAPPSAPGAVSATSVTRTSVTVAWGAATDDVGVKAYELYLGDEASPRSTTSATTATIDGLSCGTTYAVSVAATDAAGNRSQKATGQVATAACPLNVTLVRSSAGAGRLVVWVRANAAAKGSALLLVKNRVAARTTVVLRKGDNRLVFKLRRGQKGGGLVVLKLAGARAFSWQVRA